MTVGERIKQRRIELKLTQDELAKKVGYKSRSSINKIELARDLPLKKIQLMADALETSPAFLMGWESSEDGALSYYASSISMPLKMMKDFGFQMDYEEYYYALEQVKDIAGRYASLLKREIAQNLLSAADGCSDKQIQVAIDILNTFKKGE